MLIVNKESKKSISSSGSNEKSSFKANHSYVKSTNKKTDDLDIKNSFERSKENIAEPKLDTLIKNLNTAPIPNKAELNEKQKLSKKKTLTSESFENSFKKQLVTDIYQMMENSRDESWVSFF